MYSFFTVCFTQLKSALTLLEAGVLFVDHIQPSFPAHDLAIGAALFNGCSYSHKILFKAGAL